MRMNNQCFNHASQRGVSFQFSLEFSSEFFEWPLPSSCEILIYCPLFRLFHAVLLLAQLHFIFSCIYVWYCTAGLKFLVVNAPFTDNGMKMDSNSHSNFWIYSYKQCVLIKRLMCKKNKSSSENGYRVMELKRKWIIILKYNSNRKAETEVWTQKWSKLASSAVVPRFKWGGWLLRWK